jgi:hypothetical protein
LAAPAASQVSVKTNTEEIKPVIRPLQVLTSLLGLQFNCSCAAAAIRHHSCAESSPEGHCLLLCYCYWQELLVAAVLVLLLLLLLLAGWLLLTTQVLQGLYSSQATAQLVNHSIHATICVPCTIHMSMPQSKVSLQAVKVSYLLER